MITIMFADVKNSTALGGRIDVERWVEIMAHVLQLLGAEIYRYGGQVDRYEGDGLVAFFGLSAAHEDDAERAVLAALAMQAAIRRYAAELAQEAGIELLLRVGLNTGEVITTHVGEARQHGESTAMGRAIALASRLEPAAEPGTILASENIYRLTERSFEWQPMGAIPGKGFSQPLPVYRPLAALPVPGKGRGIPGLVSPLVGRDAELETLRRALETLRAGVGGIVTLAGEAGLGKSRLVAELRESNVGLPGGQHWIEGRCLSYTTGVALWLWLDVLRGLLGVPPNASPATTHDALRERVGALCPDRYDEVYPYLAHVMSLPLPDEVAAGLRGLDAQSLQHITFHALETLIGRAAQQHALVLVCEDLHWADPTSLALLEHLLSLTDRVPLLFLCVFRPETAHGCWRVKERAAREYPHRHTDLVLDPLSRAESEALVGNLLYLDDLSPGLRQRVLDGGEGNPFFVEEILRSLIDWAADGSTADGSTSDGGAGIAYDDVTGRWVATREPSALAIPGTLRGILRARIDRLPPEARRVLQRASVIGRTFSYSVLAAIVQDSSHSADQRRSEGEGDRPSPVGGVRALEDQLVTLLQRQMIRERGQLPERAYTFKHQLTQEAAYNSLLVRERRVTHRRVAQVLEQLYADRIEEQLGLLAQHWERAGETERAADYYRRAGEQAAAQYANEEAIAYLGRALELTPTEDLAARWDLVSVREQVYDLQGAREAQWQDLAALEELTPAMAAAVAGAAPAVGSGRQAELACRKARYALLTADYPAAIAASREAVRLAQAVQDAEKEAAGHLHWGWALVERGDYEAARPELQRALSLAQVASSRQVEASSLRFLGWISSHERDPAAAKAYHEQAIRIYRQIGDRHGEGVLLNRLGVVYWFLLSDPIQARVYHEQALGILRQVGDRVEEGWTHVSLYHTCRILGDYAAAQAHLQQALVVFRETGARAGESDVLRNLGLAGLRVGDYVGAMIDLEEAVAIPRDTHDRRRESSALGVLGLVRMQLGDYAGARDCLAQALAIDHEVGRSVRWLPAYLSRVSLTLGDEEAARAYCRQALEGMESDRRQWGFAWTALGRVLAGLGEDTQAVEMYQRALTTAQEPSLVFEALEPLAGLARVALAQGDRTEALRYVEEILSRLEANLKLENVYEPSWVCLACYEVLSAHKDPRAKIILDAAHRLLQERAGQIDDQAVRRSFLENVAANREIVAAWKEYPPEPPAGAQSTSCS